jgi:hypothetical protein
VVGLVGSGLTGRRDQRAQEKPLPQLGAAGHEASALDEEVLAKLESRRSSFSLSHFGQRTPSLPAPTLCRRVNWFPHCAHRYS